MVEIVEKHVSTFFLPKEKVPPLIDGNQHTFRSRFRVENETYGELKKPIVSGKSLLGLTVSIIDDGLGPIFVNPYLEDAQGFKHHIFDPDSKGIIFDGTSINAQRFNWTGKKPMSEGINYLVIQFTNYCGDDIEEVEFVGVVE